jgi:putative glutamate/gamma-aminobutyrate antiporter
MTEKRRVLNAFMLAMINVCAICSIKNWPLTAEYGFSSLFFLILAAVTFFIPVALVSAELATGWPETGGVFAWVKEAFGHRLGFLAIWYQWMTNIPWYPTVLSFISGAIAYTFNPALANNKFYMLFMVLALFWTATALNLRGMKMSSWVSTLGVILGTIVPGALIIGLGATWALSDKPMEIAFCWNSFFPDLSHLDQMVLLAGVALSLAGMEMSAAHAREVKNPQRDYPKAIFLSTILIIILSALGTLAIAAVIPQKQISLVSGSLDAFAYFLKAYHLHDLIPVIAILIAIGAYGQMSTWIAGPSKGLLAAAKNGDLPPSMHKVNKHSMPTSLLIFQAVVISLISLVFLFMPSVSSSFWLLLALTAQFYLLMYILMFVAAIRLRYKRPNVLRTYRVPGGIVGMWIVSGLGILSSLFTFFLGFVPPSQIDTGSVVFYELFLILGIVLTTLTPSIILLFKKRSWNK